MNYKLLFEYLNSISIPVVWTFHDCWAFTGHCAHFVTADCYKWREEGCNNCLRRNEYPKSFVDNSQKNFKLKKALFTSNSNLHIITVSNWLAAYAKQSFFCENDIRVINNGIDVEQFYPCAPKNKTIFKIIGVSSAWSVDKGLLDFYKLRNLLPYDEYEIFLVGLDKKQIKDLPKGITGITKTNSTKELAMLYSEANAFVNPTYADSFPTVNMEALACGTPVITYKTGGSPEMVDEKTGVVVEQGDVGGLVNAIYEMRKNPLSPKDCRDRAIEKYDKNKRFMDYINLYKELLIR